MHLPIVFNKLIFHIVYVTPCSQPIRVFPVPGGPKRRIPFGGPLSPVNISLKKEDPINAHLKNKYH